MFLAVGVLMGLAACGENGKGGTDQGFVGGPRPSSAGNAIVQVGGTPTVRTSLIVKNALPHWVSVYAVQGSGVDFEPKGIVPDPPTYKTCTSKLAAFRRRQGVNPTPTHARSGEVIQTPKMECEQMYIDLKRQVVPDPPTYKNCIAKLQALAKSGTGQTGGATSAAKKECEQRYVELKGEALSFLTAANWLEGEAKELGITVSTGETQAELDRYRRANYHTEATFRQFMSQFGGSTSDILLEAKLYLLSAKIERRVLRTGVPKAMSVGHWGGKQSVTEDELNEYYGENKEQLLERPERKDVRIIVTNNEAQAQAARSQIQSGHSFESVAKRMSVDRQTKASGGLIREIVTKGSSRGENLEQQSSRTYFYMLDSQGLYKARPHELIGPQRQSNNINYDLYEVTNVYPEVKQTQAQFKQQTRQEAWHEFLEEFLKKWRARTDCPAGDVATYCHESKEELPIAAIPFEPSSYVSFKELGRVEHEQQMRAPHK
jgi:foldase protein PrsA